ncbi:WD repeat, SAM and U-box domain-containing protein 1-like isoform X2 [Brienomyrus brachyistius]|uniref:WD repeat, SAM and U-box domain-containing protein 1-like isoform X2 n=1 Tax=Brienomyrus brachyistius TaxID=42636 RepID=UPI0020B21568|nr:WD repeat, SAM and U-box domain-containing protein 1-like isoform X2 [Brienomyrus brachyistius]XP_048886405.1 WD repeat, SAM and U-box domain-containing protein 1-like isoform X2 [Brienomyrus brachyistius]
MYSLKGSAWASRKGPGRRHVTVLHRNIEPANRDPRAKGPRRAVKMVSLVCTLQDHRDDVNWCAFSLGLLATCSTDKTVRVYSAADFSELPFSPLVGHGYAVHCCCFSPCGRFLASCSTDATTIVWSMDSGDMAAVLEHPGRSPVRVCTFAPGSSYLVSGASDGTLALWDFQSKAILKTATVGETAVVACSFTPCGQMLATGSTYGDLRLWDLYLNQLHVMKNAHDLGVACCHFAPQIQSDGQSVHFLLGSCGQDSLLKIWTVLWHRPAGCKLRLLHTLAGQSAPVLSCAFSADGQLLVSGSVDKTVAVYDAHQGLLLYTLKQHERYVTACAFSPKTALIATGSMDKTVNVWRLLDGSSEHGRRSGGCVNLLASDWSEDDVSAWLCEEGLDALVSTFKANNIDGAELLGLTKETLTTELKVDSLGLRNKLLRKVEELKMSMVCTGVPDEFLCPITREIMTDPVIAADGFSYEKDAIEGWISSRNRSSPMTNLPLQTTVLTPNRTLKLAIGRWKATQL